MEERFGTLEETMQQLVHNLANLGLFQNNQNNRPPQNFRNQEDKTLRVDIPDFDCCTHDPETYLE